MPPRLLTSSQQFAQQCVQRDRLSCIQQLQLGHSDPAGDVAADCTLIVAPVCMCVQCADSA